ncbi:hypothetical protein NQ317_001093 [Molorchus minor]|uniref:Uncharacterized protein n=1 Tax=Molorchus minor TaxID=1323400 RepID=A0ABQ9J5P1_9CUCU|nr:hypothetical protein NQ317_001093 [Molorchus minor]
MKTPSVKRNRLSCGILEYEIVSSKRSRFLRSQHSKMSVYIYKVVGYSDLYKYHETQCRSWIGPILGARLDVLHRLSGRYRQIAIKDTMSWYMNKKGDIDV